MSTCDENVLLYIYYHSISNNLPDNDKPFKQLCMQSNTIFPTINYSIKFQIISGKQKFAKFKIEISFIKHEKQNGPYMRSLRHSRKKYYFYH